MEVPPPFRDPTLTDFHYALMLPWQPRQQFCELPVTGSKDDAVLLTGHGLVVEDFPG
jgi:hypothetical protein